MPPPTLRNLHPPATKHRSATPFLPPQRAAQGIPNPGPAPFLTFSRTFLADTPFACQTAGHFYLGQPPSTSTAACNEGLPCSIGTPMVCCCNGEEFLDGPHQNSHRTLVPELRDAEAFFPDLASQIPALSSANNKTKQGRAWAHEDTNVEMCFAVHRRDFAWVRFGRPNQSFSGGGKGVPPPPPCRNSKAKESKKGERFTELAKGLVSSQHKGIKGRQRS